jgi:hypothetical protein
VPRIRTVRPFVARTGRAALVIAAVPAAALSQTITSVRVPFTATERYAPNACTATTTQALADSPEKSSGNSRLAVRVENDRNAPTRPADDLLMLAGKQATTLAKDSTAATVTGSYVGQTLTITRRSDGVAVCALTVPAAAAATGDSVARAIRVGIGGSFDFLSGISPTDLYYDVTAFFPQLWNPRVSHRGKGRILRIGIDAGLYNGRIVPKRDTTVTMGDGDRMGARSVVLPRTAPTDSVRRIQQTVLRSRRESVDRLGVYVAPTLQVADGLLLVAQSELVRRDVVEESRTRVIAQDTITQAPDPGRPLTRAGSLVPADTTIRSRSQQYVGLHSLGLLANVRMGDVEFRAKPTIGKVYGDSAGSRRWGPAIYTVQFRVTDFANGFKIGGDVRGLIDGSQTTFLVFLAKDFGLKRLGNFVLGGEGGDGTK